MVLVIPEEVKVVIEGRLRNTIEVRGEEIASELFWLVEENLRRRGKQLIQFDPQFHDFFGSSLGSDGEGRVRYAIERADVAQKSVKVGLRLRAPKSVVDTLLERVRRPLHQLAVFYVGLLAEKQKTFNTHAISALRLLLEISSRRSKEAGEQTDAKLVREVVELRQETTQLRAEVDRLCEVIRRLEDDLENLALQRFGRE